MSSLKELQDSFQRALTEGDDAFLAEIVDTSKEKRDVLLGVYRNAYVLRLIEFLAHDYEKLHGLLGDAQFEAMARAYIADTPSNTPNARWYGARLPGWLREAPGWRETPVLAELAALEKALNDVFDASDEPALSFEDVAGIAPEAWPGLVFTSHPAVRRLDFTTNVIAIWRALHAREAPPDPATLPEREAVIVSRPDTAASFRPMPPDEAMMWDEAAKGIPFSVLCEMLATFAGEEEAAPRAAGYLRGWIECGLLAKG